MTAVVLDTITVQKQEGNSRTGLGDAFVLRKPLQFAKMRVDTIFLDQFRVGPDFSNQSVLHGNNSGGVLNGGQSVRDDKRGAAFH